MIARLISGFRRLGLETLLPGDITSHNASRTDAAHAVTYSVQAFLMREYSTEYRPRVSRFGALRVGRRPLAVRSCSAHCWMDSRGLGGLPRLRRGVR